MTHVPPLRCRITASLALCLLGACGGGGNVGSIGAVLGRDADTRALYVRDAPEGLAADEAGLLPGDEIVMISGRYVRDLDRDEISRLLRGDVGTTVELTVLRGSDVRHVSVKRRPLRERDGVKPKEETIEP